MCENIKFQSEWFERCIRDYLKLEFGGEAYGNKRIYRIQ